MPIFAKIDFRGLQYHPEVLVELKTRSTICGTHVQTILNHKDLTGSAVGVREGQNTEQYGAIWGNFLPYFDLPTHPLPTRSNYYGSKWWVETAPATQCGDRKEEEIISIVLYMIVAIMLMLMRMFIINVKEKKNYCDRIQMGMEKPWPVQ